MSDILKGNIVLASALSKSVKFSLAFFLMASIILPTGNLSGIPIKIISLIILISVMILDRKGIAFSNFIRLTSLVVIFIGLEVAFSLCYSTIPSSLVLSQAKDIFVFFIMVAVCLSFSNDKSIFYFILDVIVYSTSIVGFIKIVIILYSIIKGIPVSVIVEMISDKFDIALMNFDVTDSLIARINFPSDSIILIAIFHLVTKFAKGISKKKDIIYIGFILFSALITMSRYQWATASIAIAISLVCNLRSKRIFLVSVFLSLLAVIALSNESVQNMISARFDQNTISVSDSIRYIQQYKIFQKINQNPLLGHGLGYYLPDYIRSNITLYAYELQIPALVMQIGFIGTFIVFALTLAPILMSSLKTSKSDFFSVWAITIMFISAAFFNPTLFSSSGGAGIVGILALSKIRMRMINLSK